MQGVDKFLPVDVYIQGCPPSPDAFIYGLTLLQQYVGQEKRPLTWTIGPQERIEPARPSMRDIRRPARQQETELRPPDEV